MTRTTTSITIAAALMLAAPAAKAECDIEAVGLNAIYKRAAEVCGKSHMNTPVGMAIQAVSDDCALQGREPYIAKLKEAWAKWDRVVKQKGKAFACKEADSSFGNIEKSLAR
jgi:hypothetical protein